MIVKICGIKTLEIALAALEAGADMLGFNFYPPSARYIRAEDCTELVASLKSQVTEQRAYNIYMILCRTFWNLVEI